MILSELISPIKKYTFLSDFYEKKVCYIERKNSMFYQDLFTVKDLDELLNLNILSYPDTRIANAIQEIDKSSYVTGDLINPIKFVNEFLTGSTMVFSQLQRKSAKLGKFADLLSKDIHHKIQTNIYYTPANSQGFKVHYDTHDVFVLQIEGTKEWKIYNEVVKLAMLSEHYNSKLHNIGEEQMSLTLKPGDLLYIPRGIAHKAVSTDVNSLHITTGVIPKTWLDLVANLLLKLSIENPELRQTLPLCFGDIVFDGSEKAIEILKQNLTANNLNSIRKELYYDFLSSQRVSYPKLISNINQLQELKISSMLKKGRNVPYHISKSTIYINSVKLEFPDFVEEYLHFIEGNDKFTISDMPDGMDDEGKITFAKKMISSGLLKIETI